MLCSSALVSSILLSTLERVGIALTANSKDQVVRFVFSQNKTKNNLFKFNSLILCFLQISSNFSEGREV